MSEYQLQVRSFKPAAASTTSVAAAQTLGGAGDMTLAGTAATFAGTNTVALITLTSSGNISGVNFTITGTDANGAVQSETIAGPNANTVSTTKYFATVTQIAASGAVGTNTSAGNSAETAGVIFAGANRVKGAQITTGGTIGDVSFALGSPTGDVLFFYTVATTTKDYIEPYIPDAGILFRKNSTLGSYIKMPAGTVTSATVYYG